MFRSTSGTRRVTLVLVALLLSALLVLPTQSQRLLQHIGVPLAPIVTLPIEALAALDRSLRDMWEGYVALHEVHEENLRLRREIELLHHQNSRLQEAASASQRLTALLEFKGRARSQTVAAQVIGREATNWYRAMVVNKGEADGVRVEMGVITPAGVVGRVVKTTGSASMVLLVTDPNNAITGLIQRTRDEGIVEGTAQGLARMKYLPLLSTVRAGDRVVTSGLTGGFPRGLPIGVITSIDKMEGDLFQSGEIVPDADLTRLEEVLIITAPRGEADSDAASLQAQPPQQRKP